MRWLGGRGMGAAVIAALAVLPDCAGGASRPGAPAAGPAPANEVVPVELAGPLLGLKWNGFEIDVVSDYLDTVGWGVTFFEVAWCDVEADEGRRDWTRADRALADADRHGFELFIKLRVGSCWATGTPGTRQGWAKAPSALPLDPVAYDRFVTDVVARYAPQGVHVYAIENEVNALTSWEASAEAYGQLATRVAAAIRRADPEARVLDSGLSSIGYAPVLADRLRRQGKSDEAVEVYRTLLRRRFAQPGFVLPPVDDPTDLDVALATAPARAAIDTFDVTLDLARSGVVDAIQLHYYEPVDTLQPVLDLWAAELPEGTALEAWEVGVAWPGGDYEATEHAGETVRLVTTLLAEGIHPVLYLPVAWTPSQRRPNEIWRGLLEADGTPRPAAAAFARLAELLEGDRATIRPVQRDGIRGAIATTAGRSVLVVWSDAGASLRGLPPAGDATTAVGEPLAADGEVRLGPEPVVLTYAGDVTADLARLFDDPAPADDGVADAMAHLAPRRGRGESDAG